MKRALLTAPLVLLFLLNSCINDPQAGISAAQWTMAIETQTAAVWTITPTPTFNPNIPNMVNWLNADLMSPGHSLESTMDAEYRVNNITFPNLPALTFRVDVGCMCMNNANCCIPERAFVVILESLTKNSLTTLAQIPSNVSQMLVVCSDQKTKSQIGTISASWQDVHDFLMGNLSGNQLGVRVTRTIAP